MKKLLLSALLAIGSLSATFAQSSEWATDPMHSAAIFRVRHVVSHFYGNFKTFNVDVSWNEADPTKSSVSATLDPGSVSTGSEDRDNHLKSADFFDTANHPQWSFKSTKIEKTEAGFVAHGTLSARGKSKEVAVPFVWQGVQDMGKRGKKAGAAAEFTILRSDFGLGEAGGMLGDDVTIIVALELNGK